MLAPPTWVARNGEFAFYNSGTLNRVYFYSGNQWNYLEFNAAGNTVTNGGGIPSPPPLSVQYNSSGYFGGDSGFLYYSQTAVAIGTDMKLIYNANSASNTYTVYTTSNTYLEFYLNGEIRLQM